MGMGTGMGMGMGMGMLQVLQIGRAGSGQEHTAVSPLGFALLGGCAQPRHKLCVGVWVGVVVVVVVGGRGADKCQWHECIGLTARWFSKRSSSEASPWLIVTESRELVARVDDALAKTDALGQATGRAAG